MLDPGFDIGTEPQARTARPEVDNGTWHLGILVEVQAHAVPLGKPDDLGDLLGVDELFCADERHARKDSTAVFIVPPP